MLAVEKPVVREEEFLHDSASRRVLEAVNRFAGLLTRLGYNVSPYSQRALQKLQELPLEKKNEIAKSYDTWSSWIDLPGTAEVTESDLLKEALDLHGFVADEEFWKTLEKGEIVEIYTGEMIQLYRSFNFFEVTGYSLLDIAVFEWYLLWQRSTKAIEETVREAQEVLKSYVPVKKFGLSKQIIRETYASATEPFVPRAILAEFKHLGSLRSKTGGPAPVGLVCSSRARVIAVGDEALNIAFV